MFYDTKNISGDLTTIPKQHITPIIQNEFALFKSINEIILSIIQGATISHDIDPSFSRITLLFAQVNTQQYELALHQFHYAVSLLHNKDFSIAQFIKEVDLSEQQVMQVLSVLNISIDEIFINETEVYTTEDGIDYAIDENEEDPIIEKSLIEIIEIFSEGLAHHIKYNYIPTVKSMHKKDPSRALEILEDMSSYITVMFPQLLDIYHAQPSFSIHKNIQEMQDVLATDDEIFSKVDKLMQIMVNNNSRMSYVLRTKRN